MKHKLVSIFFLLFSQGSFAQSKIGVVVFPQISSLSNKEIREDSVNKNLLTFSGGAGVTFTNYISKKISLQTGIFYSSQNQKIKTSYKDKTGTISFENIGKKRFDYLKVPVLLRYSLPLGKRTNLIPFGGIQLSYLLKFDGGMIVYNENSIDLPSTPKGNNYYKKMVMDIPIGISIEYALSPKVELVLGGKFDYALTNPANNDALYNGIPISAYGGISQQKQHLVTYGVNLGLSFSINKKGRIDAPSNKSPMLAHQKAPYSYQHNPHQAHHHKKDTVTLEGKHHQRHHANHTSKSSSPVVSSNRDHVGEMFDKSYSSLIKGVVYKKGTNEILNNTKIILETEDEKVDSSITAIGGMYTLHVQNRTARHQMYVYKKGFKPLLIDIPDTLLDRHQVSVVKIQLEPDGSNHVENQVIITLHGKVLNGYTGEVVSGASIVLKNNIDKTTRQINADVDGNYRLELKKYCHYTLYAVKGRCESEKLNKSTISIKESTRMEADFKISCP